MSSNYPPGVSEGTYGAPWNDEDIEVELEFTVKVTLVTTIQGPASEEQREDAETELEQMKDGIMEAATYGIQSSKFQNYVGDVEVTIK